jgi:hypothetical protein
MTSPLNPLSNVGEGTSKPSMNMIFSPFSRLEKGVGGMRLKNIFATSIMRHALYNHAI